MDLFLEGHADKIDGVLSCFDRVVITGTIPGLCFAKGMTSYLYANGIRIFDYPKWAEPLRDEIRQNAERLAAEAGLEIEFIRKNDFRKEEQVRKILRERGHPPGLVHIFSAMETCPTYKPWHDKKTHRTFLKNATSKCLHYYFYFIDKNFGLCYVRLPTWCPFRMQIYFNGHNWLASKLKKKKISYSLLDNAFISIDNFQKAQKEANSFDVSKLHKCLDSFAKIYCPILFPAK